MAKPFAAFDVDGTIFKSSLAEKVVDRCIAEGIFPAEEFNLVYANRKRWQVRNNEGLYQAYMQRLIGALVKNMAGVEVKRFDEVAEAMIEEQQVRKFAFPRRLMETVKDSHSIVAISGSPDILVKPFLQDLQVRNVYGSTFEHKEGVFTGVAKSVGNKAEVLKGLVDDRIVSQTGSIAVGDTISDVPMLTYADKAIIFNASNTLTSFGKEYGWVRVNEVKDNITVLITHGPAGSYHETDLDSLLGHLPGQSSDGN